MDAVMDAGDGLNTPPYGASSRSSSSERGRSDDDSHGSGPEVPFARQFRWPQELRRDMVLFLGSKLEPRDKKRMGAPGVTPGEAPWPSTFKKHYDELHENVTEALRKQGCPEGKLPTRRAVLEAGKKWTRRFLQTGTVFSNPAHQKGYKHAQRLPHLAKILEMIKAGYKDNSGNTRLYRNLEQLQAKRGEDFNEEFKATKLKTLRGLWLELKQAFPRLNKVAIRVKKERDNASVQV